MEKKFVIGSVTFTADWLRECFRELTGSDDREMTDEEVFEYVCNKMKEE